ncbi:transposase domain-containing protein [Streptomyces omiyaensis]|uniref:Transposase domain-containing protein n=1 Tax=Streptomyces omiyaensis TaxID=68247 RepID=A0ABW7C0S0_9ACTN|nr:transposase domain-containing protein [Streptomyces omiyaensis]
MGALSRVFTAELVDGVMAKHDRIERRHRLLSARRVVCFVLAPCLCQDGTEDADESMGE